MRAYKCDNCHEDISNHATHLRLERVIGPHARGASYDYELCSYSCLAEWLRERGNLALSHHNGVDYDLNGGASRLSLVS